MLNRTRRLLGFAKPISSAIPLIDDPRVQDWLEPKRPDQLAPADGAQPHWHDDLESLFEVVDSRLAERRSIVTVPADVAPQNPGTPAPQNIATMAAPIAPPKELWIGFGLEDPAAAEATDDKQSGYERLAEQLVAKVRAELLGGELTATVRQAAREAVDEALRDRLGTEVRASVEAAFRDLAPQPAMPQNEGRAMRPSAVISIRLRRRRAAHTGTSLLSLRI